MGEAKRRKAKLGEKYGQESRILPWLPISILVANIYEVILQ